MGTLNAAEARRVFRYNAVTGDLSWAVRPHPRSSVRPGDAAGTINGDGYLQVKFRGKAYPAHRIIWLYMTGEWPNEQIDHVNRVRTDNTWGNLREASIAVNAQNRVRPRTKFDLPRCVFTTKHALRTLRKPYRVTVVADGKRHYGGLFATVSEAERKANQLLMEHSACSQ